MVWQRWAGKRSVPAVRNTQFQRCCRTQVQNCRRCCETAQLSRGNAASTLQTTPSFENSSGAPSEPEHGCFVLSSSGLHAQQLWLSDVQRRENRKQPAMSSRKQLQSTSAQTNKLLEDFCWSVMAFLVSPHNVKGIQVVSGPVLIGPAA